MNRRTLLVSAATLVLAAAGPTNSFLTVTPLPDFGTSARAKKAAPASSGDYTAAPNTQPGHPAATAGQAVAGSVGGAQLLHAPNPQQQ